MCAVRGMLPAVTSQPADRRSGWARCGHGSKASPHGFALVVADGDVLLGRLRRAALEGDPNRPAEEAMEAGPSTVRMDTPLDLLAKRLDKGGLKTAVVTTPDGLLVGALRREDVERRSGRPAPVAFPALMAQDGGHAAQCPTREGDRRDSVRREVGAAPWWSADSAYAVVVTRADSEPGAARTRSRAG